MSDDTLFVDRLQHALHGSFHVVNGLIDDLVQTHIQLLAVHNGLGRRIRADVESDDDGTGSGSQARIGLGDGTDAAVDNLDGHFFVGQLHKTLLHGLDRTLYIGLYDDRKLLHIAGLDLCKETVQSCRLADTLEKNLLALGNVGIGDASRLLLAVKLHEDLAGAGNIV